MQHLVWCHVSMVFAGISAQRKICLVYENSSNKNVRSLSMANSTLCFARWHVVYLLRHLVFIFDNIGYVLIWNHKCIWCTVYLPESLRVVLAPKPPRKTRAELMKDVDADYYGYRDEDDCILVPLEKVSNQIWAFDVLKPSEQLKCIFAGLRPSIMHDAYVCVKPCPLILFQYRASKFEGSWTQTKSCCVFLMLSVLWRIIFAIVSCASCIWRQQRRRRSQPR